MIANGGKKIEPKFITSIYSKDGKKIYDTRLKKCFGCRFETILSKNQIPYLKVYGLKNSFSLFIFNLYLF